MRVVFRVEPRKSEQKREKALDQIDHSALAQDPLLAKFGIESELELGDGNRSALEVAFRLGICRKALSKATYRLVDHVPVFAAAECLQLRGDLLEPLGSVREAVDEIVGILGFLALSRECS